MNTLERIQELLDLKIPVLSQREQAGTLPSLIETTKRGFIIVPTMDKKELEELVKSGAKVIDMSRYFHRTTGLGPNAEDYFEVIRLFDDGGSEAVTHYTLRYEDMADYMIGDGYKYPRKSGVGPNYYKQYWGPMMEFLVYNSNCQISLYDVAESYFGGSRKRMDCKHFGVGNLTVGIEGSDVGEDESKGVYHSNLQIHRLVSNDNPTAPTVYYFVLPNFGYLSSKVRNELAPLRCPE